ncbi:MAG: class I SAM-dependent methyltransferase [Candidatus Moranbacteria bacterium]|nr:class I SAM-dependent methyltransferase [Candidatus Moranbacteria bacterium]
MSIEEKRDFVKLIRRMPWLYKPILDALKEYLSLFSNLLDVACGDGYLLELVNFLNPSCRLYGLDVDSFFVNEGRKKYNFQFNLNDVYCLEEKHEIVTCNLALHHFEDPVSLVRKLLDCSTNVLLISDQVRPATQIDLERRLKRRKLFIGDKEVPFYEKNERESILEAYSKSEIEEVFSEIKNNNARTRLEFIDSDYYERFVVVIER